jgi:hypothetical protein
MLKEVEEENKKKMKKKFLQCKLMGGSQLEDKFKQFLKKLWSIIS